MGISGFTEEIDFRIVVNGLGLERDTNIERAGYALFGQGTYTLWDRLHLTAGLRYDYLDLEGEQYHRDIGMMGPIQNTYKGERDSGEVLPKFSLGYDVNKNIMTYITMRLGSKICCWTTGCSLT